MKSIILAVLLSVAVCANALAQTPPPSVAGAPQASSRGHTSHHHIKTLVLSVGLIAVFTLLTPRSK